MTPSQSLTHTRAMPARPHRTLPPPARRPRISPWLGALALLLALPASAAKPLRICVDQAPWPPFIEVDAQGARGSHVEIIRRAVQASGGEAQFLPMPWLRCLLEAREGTVDAVATLIHSDERARFLQFPADAAQEHATSRWSVGDIDDVVVTLAASGYEFDGDLSRLPTPVRVPRGWGIGPFLRKAGVTVDDGAPSDEANIVKLLRDGRGSVVALAESMQRVLAQSSAAGRLKVSPRPLRSKSFFLAFSRAAGVAEARRLAIWESIARERHPAPAPG